jgi:hypothetical protein
VSQLRLGGEVEASDRARPERHLAALGAAGRFAQHRRLERRPRRGHQAGDGPWRAGGGNLRQCVQDRAAQRCEGDPALENRDVRRGSGAIDRQQDVRAVGLQSELPGLGFGVQGQGRALGATAGQVGDSQSELSQHEQDMAVADARGEVHPVDEDVDQAEQRG